MPIQVVNLATLTCVFGMAPSMLVVTPEKRVLSGMQPAAQHHGLHSHEEHHAVWDVHHPQ